MLQEATPKNNLSAADIRAMEDKKSALAMRCGTDEEYDSEACTSATDSDAEYPTSRSQIKLQALAEVDLRRKVCWRQGRGLTHLLIQQ